jgi:Mg-chelatase subunit ChlD
MSSAIKPFKNAPVTMNPFVQRDGVTHKVHLEVVPPTAPTGDYQGQVFTFIFDTSGSMYYDACKVGDDARNYHTRMDLLKLVAELMVRMMTEDDTLYLVGFSDNGYELMRPAKMTAAGKESAVAAIKRMSPSGCTNLWNALEVAHAEMSKVEYAETIKHAIMLTDGDESYAAPHPQGTVGAFTALPRSFTLNIMGFGSTVKPEILAGLCAASGGRFSNVADFTTLATTSINIMATALATCSDTLPLFVQYEDGSTSEHKTSLIQYGQPRNVVLVTNKKPVTASTSRSAPVALTEGISPAALCRYDLTAAIRATIASGGRAGSYSVMHIKYCTTDAAPHCAEAHPDTGELVKATADAATWTKWGSKYSWAYLQALENDHRMNFKELGQAHLGAAVFERFKGVGDVIFSRIPKPAATGNLTTGPPNTGEGGGYGGGSGYGGGGYTAPPATTRVVANVAATNDPRNSGGCWSPESLILMADGKYKEVQHVEPGDYVWTEGGYQSKVLYRLELGTYSSVLKMCHVDNLWLTPYHPVKIGGVWRNPCDLVPTVEVPIPKLFNLILDGGSVVDIGGVLTVSLGHELSESGVAHPFFGSRERIMEAIKGQPGFAEGRVVFNNLVALHDNATGMIDGWSEGGNYRLP